MRRECAQYGRSGVRAPPALVWYSQKNVRPVRRVSGHPHRMRPRSRRRAQLSVHRRGGAGAFADPARHRRRVVVETVLFLKQSKAFHFSHKSHLTTRARHTACPENWRSPPQPKVLAVPGLAAAKLTRPTARVAIKVTLCSPTVLSPARRQARAGVAAPRSTQAAASSSSSGGGLRPGRAHRLRWRCLPCPRHHRPRAARLELTPCTLPSCLPSGRRRISPGTDCSRRLLLRRR